MRGWNRFALINSILYNNSNKDDSFNVAAARLQADSIAVSQPRALAAMQANVTVESSAPDVKKNKNPRYQAPWPRQGGNPAGGNIQ